MAFSRLSRLSVALLAVVVILGVASYAEGGVLFSKLPKTLIVTATLPDGAPITQVQTGQDSILVTWKLNTTTANTSNYSKIQTKLCFAKVSQVLRSWRKTVDNLSLDKTCLYKIATVPFAPTGSTTYKLARSVPGAQYFVRAYALDAAGNQVAFGQTSPDKANHTFTVIPISGRHASIDIAVAVFSIFSVGSLFAFFLLESIYLKRKKAV